MKRMGVLGGIGPQATIDFEARVHAVSQRLIPQDGNAGYPPMAVWYHRRLPMRCTAEGEPLTPMEVDPGLLEAARELGRWADFLAIPCNAAHNFQAALETAAGRPVLSMIDLTLAEVRRRRWARVGVVGFHAAPPVYLAGLRGQGVAIETIGPDAQRPLDAAIRALLEGRQGPKETDAARGAIAALRASGVDGSILGCTEIPLLLGAESEAVDLVNPAAVLAEAAVRFAMEA